MGWTHNWQRETELPHAPFAAAVRDCQEVLARTGIPLAGFDGNGAPIFRDDMIAFNGTDRTGCEPFEIHQTEFDRRGGEMVWSFCKTEHLPYDLCVQAALVVMKHHLGDAIIVGSDGKDQDWAEARRICQEHLGYGHEFRLSSGDTRA